MANPSSAFFYWYRRYKVRAADMNLFQQSMVETARGLGEGSIGSAVLKGMEVTVGTGLELSVAQGIALGASGYLHVHAAAETIDLTGAATGSFPSRALIVASADPTDVNDIPSPTSPYSPVPLNQLQMTSIRVLPGTAAQNPDYPAKPDINDTILCGVRLPVGVTQITAEMLDFDIRELPGTNSLLQKNQGHADDRLRPSRLSPKSIGIKSSQTSGSGPRLFSYPNGTSPSLFPLAGGAHVDADTLIDPSTGAITGGDTTTPDFTPVIPSGSNSIILAIGLNTDDSLSFAYGTQGTYAQCVAAIEQSVTSGAGSLPNTGGVYPIAYAIVSSFGGTYSDCQVLDMRPVGGGGGGGGASPIFFDEVLGIGNGVQTTFTLPLTPKDASSVLPRIDGLVSDPSDYSINTAGPTVTFTAAPALGQTVSAYGVAAGPSTISGHSENPAGVVNGVNRLFSLTIKPVDQNSSLLLLDGQVVDPTEWSLIQSAGVSFVQFNTAPATGQAVALFCLINVIAAGTPPVITPIGSYASVGSRLFPHVVDLSAGISPTADSLQHWYVSASGGVGASVITQNPPIAPGTVVAQVLKLTVVDPTDFPLLPASGNGLSLDGDWPNLASPDRDGATITLSWDGVQWSEDSRR